MDLGQKELRLNDAGFSQKEIADWKKQNLKDIENRLSGWQLKSFIKSYKNKVGEGISLYKKNLLKK